MPLPSPPTLVLASFGAFGPDSDVPPHPPGIVTVPEPPEPGATRVFVVVAVCVRLLAGRAAAAAAWLILGTFVNSCVSLSHV